MKRRLTHSIHSIGLACLLQIPLMLVLTSLALALPSFSKSFSPSTIGPGSNSLMIFTISNGDATAVEDLQFFDSLPSGMTLTTPAVVENSCGGTFYADDGGTYVSLYDARLGANTSCTIKTYVTSSTLGPSVNTTGDLTSTAGNSGTASATLTVNANSVAFTKSFSPASISYGGVSTLTFTLDNSASSTDYSPISFADTLPAGIVVAATPNVATTCHNTTVTAVAGAQSISASGTFTIVPPSLVYPLPAGGSCTVSVDVQGVVVGTHNNITQGLFGGSYQGYAIAGLEVTGASDLLLAKSFPDNPSAPGDIVPIQFTVTSLSRDDTATGVTFSDDLDAVLSGMVATNTPLANPCGAGSTVTGSDEITLTGGSLAPGSSCAFTVYAQVPPGAANGEYLNTTTAVSGSVGSRPTTGNAASYPLIIRPSLQLTKDILETSVGAGDGITMRFTVTNPSSTESASGGTFSDSLATFASISGISDDSGFCIGNGTLTYYADTTGYCGTPPCFFVTGINLAAGDSCTFDVPATITTGAVEGDYVNTATGVTATFSGGSTSTSPPASDTLTVVGGPRLTKAFSEEVVSPGDTLSLQFTLEHSSLAPGDATNISFTDDLNAAISGLAATGLPLSDVCGTGSQISGTTSLTLMGGLLAPGEICTFSVDVTVPPGTATSTYTNTTSSVTATVDGTAVESRSASDTLQVGHGVVASKSFSPAIVAPGGATTLTFTLLNNSTESATITSFTDDIDANFSGLTIDTGSLPTNPCGATSTLGWNPTTHVLTLPASEVVLSAGQSCNYSVTVNTPSGAASGSYDNFTSNVGVNYSISGARSEPRAHASLSVVTPLTLTKSFVDDPTPPGGTGTLEFTLTNNLAADAVTNISFTDDLDAALSGLTASSLPANGFCGAGSTISGTSTLTIAGGNLAGGGSCTFQVTYAVPGGATAGTTVTNTTSSVSADVNAVGTTSDPASADLRIAGGELTKTFLAPIAAGGNGTLRFTLTNKDASNSLNNIAFSDDLDATLTGLVAEGLPLSDVCGAGSSIAGTGLIALSGGSLLGGGTCTFDVPVRVPSHAVPGDYLNTTSLLTSGGITFGDSATATLQVYDAPDFNKAFQTTQVRVGQSTTLRFTIDNHANVLTASGLGFSDSLPNHVQVAPTPNASSTCTGGAITAQAGSSSIAYSNGSVAAGASCVVDVDVVADAAGTYVNTSSVLSSSLGSSGTASDTLYASQGPAFSKSFSPGVIVANGLSTLTFTINNSANPAAATGLSFTDTFPSGMLVASTPNASTTCTGGVLTAVAGSGSFAYSGGSVSAGGNCTARVDVTASAGGTYNNTSSLLQSSWGNSTAAATDTLEVDDTKPAFSKAFSPVSVLPGDPSTLTLTINNSANAAPVSSLDFTDNLPAGMSLATPPNASTTCTGGTLTAVAGTQVISYTGGSLAAGANCTVQADVVVSSNGQYLNTTGALTSDAGDSGTAQATLYGGIPPTLTMGFNPASVNIGNITRLTYLIDNTGNPSLASGLGFVHNLPTGQLIVANPSNLTNTCGGSVDAQVFGGSVTFSGGSVAGSSTCAINVDVLVIGPGSIDTGSVSLSSNFGASTGGSTSVTGAGAGIPAIGPVGFAILASLLGLGLTALGVRRRRR